MREGSPLLQRKRMYKYRELYPPLCPCNAPHLHPETITGKINAEFKEILKKIPLFLKSTILQCALWCSYPLSHLKSSVCFPSS